jgi:hypothetical protein
MNKIRKVIALREVGDDLYEGKHFYDDIEFGVGDYFWDSIMGDIKSLLLYGGIHTQIHGFYRMAAKRFPCSIYYLIERKIVQVVAVLPMRKNPKWIKDKLRRRKMDFDMNSFY